MILKIKHLFEFSFDKSIFTVTLYIVSAHFYYCNVAFRFKFII